MSAWNDLRYAARALWKEPGFATVALLTLAFGVGANTAIFSIVNGVLLRPLPYAEPERLVALHEAIAALERTYPRLPVSARHFTEWRTRAKSFENLSAIFPESASLSGAGEPERFDAERVSANFFDTLGVKPALGRGFLTGEDQEGRDRVVIISDSLWRRRFGSDPSVIGKTVSLDSRAHTVVGVLPPSFRFPAAFGITKQYAIQRPEIFRPLVFSSDEMQELMGTFNYGVLARLKRGTGSDRALAELNLIAGQLEKMSGEKAGLHALMLPLREAIVGESRRGLVVLLAAVGSVLLIVCVNLANLMLARGERRARELAVRTALGASRAQMLRHALDESLLIAFLGGALGIGVAAAGIGALLSRAPADIPRLAEVSLDGRVLLFALAITTITGLLFGLAPAWRASRVDPQSALKSGWRTASSSPGGVRLRSALVAAEVCLSVVLLVTAALLMSSFVRLLRVDKGFRAPAVLAADLVIPMAKYGEPAQRNQFHERLLNEVRSRPGVLSAAVSTALPLQGETWIDSAFVPGDGRSPWERPSVNVRFVSPDYLRTMGIPLLAGRDFSESDHKREVAIISERLAQTLWPGQDAVGRQFERNGGQRYEVTGVAGDVRADADRRPVAMVYRPYWDWGPRRVMLAARAAGDPLSIAGAMRDAIHRVDPDVPVQQLRTMQEVLGESVAQRRFQMLLASAFAATALLLASLGIYGVVSYSVARRANEMGIRMALGARAHDLYSMVMRQAMAPVALGLIAGLAGAMAAGRILSSLLYEISPRDPVVIGVVAAMLTAVALAACFLPARRATKVDPLVALRCE